jgi:aspartate 1-decarboxylase|tara:strand:+ start:973 stop:1323 length:351 start_codon:yes stop_codon:yes gene_type:complete
MTIDVLFSKIHRVTVTGAELNYIGSITVDSVLLKAANLIDGQKVSIVNINNGERFDTYIIPGKENSGEIKLNGPAARLAEKGDVIIIISYAAMTPKEAKKHEPIIVFPDENTNRLN